MLALNNLNGRANQCLKILNFTNSNIYFNSNNFRKYSVFSIVTNKEFKTQRKNSVLNILNSKVFSNFSIPSRNICAETSMRFIQFERHNDRSKRIGIVSEDGAKLIDLTAQSCCPNNMIQFIADGPRLSEIEQKLDCLDSEDVTDKIKLLPPITDPEKIICIGLNYLGHCQEQNKEAPKEPMFFSKFASTLVGPTDNVIHHKITNALDWEVELAVIIGKEAKHVRREDALNYVFGYSVAQDISARDWQKQRNGGQFLIGKSMDTFCPLGPAIVHKSLVPDPHNLQITCCINGVLKQCGSTNELIFRIDEIIHQLSQSITLRPGDIILTGTPSGVGMHRKPPEYLKPGDVIQSEIQCIGKLCNTVVEDS